MWRRIHILDPIQSLIVASLSAATIAIPLALQTVPRDEPALIRDLFWPDTLTPYIAFSLILIGLVLPLLGYYHLGRLGFILAVAAGFALVWVMAVCALLCFTVVGHHFRSALLGAAAYAACVALVYFIIARLHLRAASSALIRDAQRKLRLIPSGAF